MNDDKPKEFKTLNEQCDIILNQRHLQLSSANSKTMSINDLKEELLQKNYFDLINGLEDIINVSDSKNKYYGNYSLEDLLSLYNLNENLRVSIILCTFENPSLYEMLT